MSIIAIPENSQLLIVDPLLASDKQIPAQLMNEICDQFQRLSTAADLAHVPRYFAVPDSHADESRWLSKPCEKSQKRVFGFAANTSPWSSEDLTEAIRQEKRERLFVCGFWLDSTVLTTALEAYVDGYDVHLIADISPAKNSESGEIALERLLQIGVPPISTQQLIYEWMTNITSEDVCKKLSKLIDTELGD